MKKRYKVLIILLILVVATFAVSKVTLAWGINDIDVEGSSEFDGVGNSIIKVLSTMGAIISVVMLIVLGIKYMLGSLEERAEYKKTMMPYVIGALLVFAASIIAQIIYDIAINL